MSILYIPKGRAKEYANLAANLYRGCAHRCQYCLTGDTLVLKANLQSIPIKELVPGEKIVGIVEGTSANPVKFVGSIVQKIWKTKKPVFQIELENGMVARCSGDHRWLTDRGWKFTTGTMAGMGQRPYLTINNSIRVVARLFITPDPTSEYQKGYLSGVIRGDGHLGEHGPYERSRVRKDRHNGPYFTSETHYRFELRMKDTEALQRVKKYLNNAGIHTFEFNFTDTMKGIRTSKKADVDAIRDLISWHESPEYNRGFLAGIFDAEGGHGKGKTVRISNSDPEILKRIEKGLTENHFAFVYDQPCKAPNVTVQVIRLVGGRSEYIRFCQYTDPAISRKRDIIGKSLKSTSRVSRILDLGYEEDMWDIETTTENFIANGMVSHNCFGPDALHIKKEEFHDTPTPRTNALQLLEKDLQARDPALAGETVLLSFTTDPYQPIDQEHRLTRSAIELLHRYGHPVCILTKGGLRSTVDFDLLQPGDQYATTLVFNDELLQQKYEPGAAPTADRIAALQQAHDDGIFTWVSLEPVVMPRQTIQLIRETCDFVDHYKVGTLNHNYPKSPTYIPEAASIDWEMFAIEAQSLLSRLKKSYYLKEDLRRWMS